MRPGGLAWHDGVEPGFIVLSVEEAEIGGGLGEQVYTVPGAEGAQQAAIGMVPGLVFMAKPGELPSPLPPIYFGSQTWEPCGPSSDSTRARWHSSPPA